MNFLSLVMVNLGRNKLRTVLTTLSVTMALFLFCALGGILDTLKASIEVGSRQRPVVVYGNAGRASARAVRLLKQAGFTQVFDLGTLARWR